MSKHGTITDYLAVGMGGPTLLMHDGDACSGIRGYAIHAMEVSVFSVFDLNTAPIFSTRRKRAITAVTNAANTFTLDTDGLLVGDKVLYEANGATKPTASTATDIEDNQVYYVQAVTSTTVVLSISRGGAAMGLGADGTPAGSTLSKVNEHESKSHGNFTITSGSVLENTGYVDGNTDMFDTDGAEDVTIPAGSVVYLPVTAITLTTGACIVYTRK